MHMSNRSAKFASALLAGMLTGTCFAAPAETENASKTADSCLTAPKGAVPAGSHWYYRLDHANKRQCWYIGEEKAKAVQPIANPSSAASTDPAQPSSGGERKSVANARAEIPAPPINLVPEARAKAAPPLANRSANDDSPRAATADLRTQTSAVTPRWPDSVAVSPPNEPKLTAAEPPEDSLTETTALPQPTAPTAARVADPFLQKQSGSMQMLLLVMGGALAMAGLIASLIFRLGRRRRSRAYEIRDGRRAIWADVPARERRAHPRFLDEVGPMPAEPTHAEPMRPEPMRREPRRPEPKRPEPKRRAPMRLAEATQDRYTRDQSRPDDTDRQLAEMLQRLAKSAVT